MKKLFNVDVTVIFQVLFYNWCCNQDIAHDSFEFLYKTCNNDSSKQRDKEYVM